MAGLGPRLDKRGDKGLRGGALKRGSGRTRATKSPKGRLVAAQRGRNGKTGGCCVRSTKRTPSAGADSAGAGGAAAAPKAVSGGTTGAVVPDGNHSGQPETEPGTRQKE
jgi:hypothetical protein